MATHPDILDQHESLRKPFLGSVTFHALLFGSMAAFTFVAGTTEHLGDPKSMGGGSVAITPVSKIPLPAREGRVNPVANDTHSVIPSKPEKVEKVKPPEPDPDAISLKSKKVQKKRLQDRAAAQQKYTPLKDPKPNQVYNRTAPAAVSPMFSAAPGGGGVGSGSSSPFGNRFGYYEQLLRDAVSRNWHTEQFDARMQTLPAVVVSFEVFRDGSVKNVKVTQSSGNFAVDQSAQRAILASIPLPKLPQGYEHDSANLEFWFRLQK
jgi:protein TonB